MFKSLNFDGRGFEEPRSMPPNLQIWGQHLARSSIEAVVEQLRKDARFAAYELVYLDASLNNGIVSDKVDAPYAGRVHYIQNLAIARDLASFAARAWDRTGFPFVCSDLLNNASSWRQKLHEQDPEKARARIDAMQLFMKQFEHFVDSHLLERLKLFRDEHAAHLLDGRSDKRTKILNASPGRIQELDVFTLDHVRDVADYSLEMVKSITLAVQGREPQFFGDKKSIEMDVKSYWKALPKFV